ncbi:hypothetical protein Pfo_014317 [Paulownia fortunei]|nr:hypothetical protein Pfo_014317 [Paulownia fortunei]
MSNYNQNQAYPPPSTAYPAEPQGGYMAPPPPAGYPMKDGQQDQGQGQAPVASTQSRGDGFWKGWLVFSLLFYFSSAQLSCLFIYLLPFIFYFFFKFVLFF